MTGGILKLIAVISMFIDHLAVALRLGGFLKAGTLYQAMRIIGRAAASGRGDHAYKKPVEVFSPALCVCPDLGAAL